jgi:hypothetical protein
MVDVSLGRMEVVEGTLRYRKPEMNQSARRIVDEHEQGAPRTAVLKPPMKRAIDLDQLAKAIAGSAVV